MASPNQKLRRARGPRVQDTIRQDARPGPAPLLEESHVFLGSEDIDKERYTSRAFHDLEVEKVWKKTWQMACREEDIPDVGDCLVYDIVDVSLIVARVGTDDVRAYPNACLHRGRKLIDGEDHLSELRCPFHGFAWNLDGSLKQIPTWWDFEHIQRSEFCLPEVRVARWGGFVFVNLDPDAPGLDAYLGDLVRHNAAFAFPWERRYKALHVAVRIPCNWKVGIEAFIESWHVGATHAQLANPNCQYDVWEDQPHWNRMLYDGSSPLVGESAFLEGEVIERRRKAWDEALASWLAAAPAEESVSAQASEGVPDDTQAQREALVAAMRTHVANLTGDDASEVCDTELVEGIEYYIFPNLVPWYGVMGAGELCYRFRPDGNDPDAAIMEIMLLRPFGSRGHPPAAKARWIGEDEPLANVRELGVLGPVLDQDRANFRALQEGLHAMTKPGITLANYQEIRLRHVHQTLDAYLEK